jgi:hypothetical protein
MDRLQSHFSDEQVVELSVVFAILTGMAKMLAAMDWADYEDSSCLIRTD